MKLFTSLGIWGVVAGAASIYLAATMPERAQTYCQPVNKPVVRVTGDDTTDAPIVDGGLPIWHNAPTPKPVKFPSDLMPPYLIENGASSPILTFTDENRAIVTIKDGDMPKGPCDLGDLVRAVRKHLDLEHAEPSMWTSVGMPLVMGPCDYDFNGPRCRLQRAEEAVREAKAALEAEKLRADALGDLRLKLAACEVVK